MSGKKQGQHHRENRAPRSARELAGWGLRDKESKTLRRHAKALSAGSIQRQAKGLARSLGGGFATRDVPSASRGSTASKATLGALLAIVVVAACGSAPAGAATLRPFQETFGSAQQPSFSGPTALAFDQSQGSLLVASGGSGVISRFNEDGSSDAFSALGTNGIDGRRGPGNKPCVEEAASCDATPQEELRLSSFREFNLAIDESGGLTNGNIYVPQGGLGLVNIFASDGHYLGQLTQAGTDNFTEPCGVAVDPDGAVYVADYLKGVFKFVPSGNRPVNTDYSATLSSVAEPCAIAAGAGPTEGSLFVTEFFRPVYKVDAASDEVKYTVSPGTNSTETVNPANGQVLVTAGSEVAEYDASGVSSARKVTEIQAPNEVRGIAVNSASDLVYISDLATGRVEVYGPPPPVPIVITGAASNLSGTGATLNATVNPNGTQTESCSFEWGLTEAPYEHVEPCAESSTEIGEGEAPVPVHADLSGLDGGNLYHYRIVAANSDGSGEGDDRTFATPAPPLIVEESTVSVSRTEATLTVKINPRRFPTTYRVEYGKAGAPYEHSTVEKGVGSDGIDHTLTVNLEGLLPGTAYHWRVVATNADPSLPGTGATIGDERTFTTYGALVPSTNCPNQAFRTGFAAGLPDCRAYEMVSPVNKNGGDIVGYEGTERFRASFYQSSLDGSKIAYSSGVPFGDAQSGRNSNQYMATRSAGGWSTHALNAPLAGTLEEPFNLRYALEAPFKLFTPDLSSAWVTDGNVTPLTPEAAAGAPNLYRRDNLAEDYEALTTALPDPFPGGIFALEYAFNLRAHSADFEHIVFNARAALTPDAAKSTAVTQTYDFADGELHLVSVLPDGSVAEGSSSVGAESLSGDDVSSTSAGAMSDDGSRVFWSSGSVYLRENPAAPPSAQAHGSARGTGDLTAGSNEVTGVSTSMGAFSVGQTISGVGPFGTTITAMGPTSLTLSANASVTASGASLSAYSECTEPDRACTIPISESVSSGGRFELASADGSKVLFSVGLTSNTPGDLYEFDVETRTATLIAGDSWGTIGSSKDASRVYFASEEDLAAGATEGEPNIYLDEDGALTFVATVAPLDAHGGPTPETFDGRAPVLGSGGRNRGSRVSPDGRHVVFMSRSKALSEATAGYDNTDAVSGKEDREVYIYQAGGELRCVSCNPSGARPVGELMERAFAPLGNVRTLTPAAAWIPAYEQNMGGARVLTDDGARVYFNSFDALAPGDTNGIQDVYQWERPGSGDCAETSPSFSELNGGCVSLISTGQSPQVSEFVDATPNGSDVFFKTGSSLIKPDPGLVDIYDARVGGGFDYPTTSPGCEGETCQGTPTPPNDATPASAAYNGPGNVNEAAKKKQKKKSKKHKNKKKQKKSKKKGGKAKRHAANNSTRANG